MQFHTTNYRRTLLYCALFLVLHRCYVFNKLKVRPSTSKKIATCFIAIRVLLQWSRTESTISPRLACTGQKGWWTLRWIGLFLIIHLELAIGGCVLSDNLNVNPNFIISTFKALIVWNYFALVLNGFSLVSVHNLERKNKKIKATLGVWWP